MAHIAPTVTGFIGYRERRLLAILNRRKLERVLRYMLDENEFLGPNGIRSLSRYHLDHPYVLHVGAGIQGAVPAGRIEHGHVRRQLQLARTGVDARQLLIVRALVNLYTFYGDDFKSNARPGPGGI